MEGRLNIKVCFSVPGDNSWKDVYNAIDGIIEEFVDGINGTEIIVEKYNYNITVKDNGDGIVKINLKGIFTEDLTFVNAINKFNEYVENYVAKKIAEFVPIDGTNVKITVGG